MSVHNLTGNKKRKGMMSERNLNLPQSEFRGHSLEPVRDRICTNRNSLSVTPTEAKLSAGREDAFKSSIFLIFFIITVNF